MNNKKKGPNFLVIMLVSLSVIMLINMFGSALNKPTEVPLEELKTLISEKRLNDVVITPDQGVYVISGRELTAEEAKKVEEAEANQEQVSGTLVDGLANSVLSRSTSMYGKPVQTVIVGEEYKVQEVTSLLEENGISYKAVAYRAPVNWASLIFQIGSFLILGMFVFSMFKGRMPGMEQKEFNVLVPDIHFSDIIGYEEEKQELAELVDFLKYPARYKKMGAKLPKGVLLEGPPGTGKTLMARAVAGESNVPFFAVSGSDFEEMYVGVGASRIRKLFKEARKNAPAIIFIDEIDAIGSRKGGKEAPQAINQTINSLLVEMDGFAKDENIIVMGATNRKEDLDPALLRPGRFDRQILVDLPPVKTREEMLKHYLKKKNVSENVDLQSLARSTTGMSGAQLEAVANEAALLAVRERKNEINQEMLQESVDRVLMGPAKVTNKYSDHDKKVVSLHESGHCIVGLELEGAMQVQKITIIPRRDAGGYVSYIPSEEEERFMTKRQLLDRITSLLAGRASEELNIGEENVTIGAFNDFEQATNLARAMVTKYGMSELGTTQFEANGAESLHAVKQYSDQTANEIDSQIKKILAQAYQKAKEILKRRQEDVQLLAKTIREYEVLDKEQIDYLLLHRELPADLEIIYKKPTSEESENSEVTPTKEDSDKHERKNTDFDSFV